MTIGIGLGTSRLPFSNGDEYRSWVEQCEEGGVDSIWQTDTLVSTEPMLECLTTMAVVAGATKSIRFGMNVASTALRDPLILAKQCATIDFLSGGRLLPAFGIGSALGQDYKTTGTATKGRGKKTNEALALIQQLWTKETVDFSGEFFNYCNASISPKPVNEHIPLWIGGSGEAAIQRTAKYGTGWLGGLDSPEQTRDIIGGIKQALKDNQRTIDDDHYGASFSFRFGHADESIAKTAKNRLEGRLKKDASRFMVVGDEHDIQQRIEEYIDAGCSKFVMLPIVSSAKDMAEQTRLFIDKILPLYARHQ